MRTTGTSRLGAAARTRRRIRAVNRFGRSLRRISVVTVAVATLAIALGVVGRLQVPADAPDGDVSWVTIAYGTAGLFGFAGTDVADVPGALAAARLLAPLATVMAAVGLLLAAGRTRVSPWVARRAHGHALMIGSAERLDAHVADRVALVHSDTVADGRPVEDALHIPVDDPLHVPVGDEADDWLVRVSAGAARRVVIATGDDVVNLALLGRITHHQDASDDMEVVVEIDDRATAIRASIVLGTTRPGARTQVICREDALAASAAASIVAALGATEAVVVTGDGELAAAVASHVARRLVERYKLHATHRPVLGLLGEGADGDAARRVGRPTEIDVHLLEDLDAALALDEERITFVVAHADAQDGLEQAIEITSLPAPTCVHVVSAAAVLPLGLVAIPLSATRDGPLLDWWTQAAERWHALTGEGGSDPGQRAALADAIRAIVAALVARGWRAVPADASVRGAQSLSEAVLADLGRPMSWRDLPHTLETVGIALCKPATSRPLGTVARTSAHPTTDPRVEPAPPPTAEEAP